MVMKKKIKRYVLTGGPSCGKSTSIENFRNRGFSVLEEVARGMIEKRGSFPTEKKEIKKFQNEMFYEQLRKEDKLNGEMVFLDRGVGDYHAYSEHLIGYVPENTNIDFGNRYSKIFVLDRLPFIDDGLRIESGDEEAEILHNRIIQSYASAGYELVFVPVMPIEERSEFILDYINKNGN